MDKKLEEYAIDIIKNHSHKLVKNFTEEDLINRELSIFYAGYTFPKKERVKPEQPFYRPYERTLELILDFKERFPKQEQGDLPLIWVKHKQTNKDRLITGFAETSVEITSKAKDVDMKKLFELYTFRDGSPCGKME